MFSTANWEHLDDPFPTSWHDLTASWDPWTDPCGECALPINDGIWAQTFCNPTPIFLAIFNGHENCLKAWIQNRQDINYDQILSVNWNSMFAWQLFSPDGVNNIIFANERVQSSSHRGTHSGVTALLYAVATGKENMVEILLAAGAKQHTKNMGVTPLQLTMQLKPFHPKLLDMLLCAGGDVNEYHRRSGKTLLTIAAEIGNEEIIRHLLQRGANVNYNKHHATPPLCTAKTPETAKILLEAGAEINLTGRDGHTAFMNSALYGNIELLQTLLDLGACVNQQDITGASALFYAAFYGQYETVKVLMQHGAKVDVAHFKVGSALVGAAKRGFPKMVKMLLSAKAKVNITREIHMLSDIPMYCETPSVYEECICLMFAAGERMKRTMGSMPHEEELVPVMVKQNSNICGTNLQDICCKSIRTHLLASHENLFQSVPKLGLPSPITDFLLYGMSIEGI